jgi:hypothetical protein
VSRAASSFDVSPSKIHYFKSLVEHRLARMKVAEQFAVDGDTRRESHFRTRHGAAGAGGREREDKFEVTALRAFAAGQRRGKMTNNQEGQGGLPRQEAEAGDTHAGAGDAHPARTGEAGHPNENASGNAGQRQTGGTGGYGGTSAAAAEDQTEK